MKYGRTLNELAMELTRRENEKKDYKLDTRNMHFDADKETEQLSLINEKKGVTIALGVNSIAHQQIGTALGIPPKYYQKMREENPSLLATNINSWFQNSPKVRFVRTLDNTTRAFLGETYFPMDNYQVAERVLPIIASMPDARIESCEVTDTRMYIKVVNPRLTTEVVPGDIVQSGIIITNSEVGMGALTIMPLIYRLVCKNGMTVNDAKNRQRHIGRGISADEDFSVYSDETLRLENMARMAKAEDTVKAVVDEVRFEKIVNVMRQAKGAKIETTNIPAMVELTGTEFGFTKQQGTGILDHLIRGGDLTLYGMANAVTRYAQDVDSYDESTRLEGLGWSLIDMPKSKWDRLNAVATVR